MAASRVEMVITPDPAEFDDPTALRYFDEGQHIPRREWPPRMADHSRDCAAAIRDRVADLACEFGRHWDWVVFSVLVVIIEAEGPSVDFVTAAGPDAQLLFEGLPFEERFVLSDFLEKAAAYAAGPLCSYVGGAA